MNSRTCFQCEESELLINDKRKEIETLRAKLNRTVFALRIIDSDCRKCFAKGFEFDIESTRDYIAIVLKEIEETK